MLDVVELGEETAGIGRAVAMEFVPRLLAEIRAVHEEEDPAGFGKFDEPIGKGAGGKGFPGTGGHVDEGARAVLSEGLLQAGDGFDLAIAHAIGGKRVGESHVRETATQGVRLGAPLCERLGAMEGKDAPGTGRGIAFVAEKGFDAGGFVEERERAGQPGGEDGRQAVGVAGGLIGNGRECGADLFGFNDAEGLAIHEEQVIARTSGQRDFPQCDAPTGGEVR